MYTQTVLACSCD